MSSVNFEATISNTRRQFYLRDNQVTSARLTRFSSIKDPYIIDNSTGEVLSHEEGEGGE
jgi:hypothetical protein